MLFQFYSMPRNFLMLLSLLFSMNCHSQSNIIWQNTIGGSENDALHDMIIARNGNIILSGYSQSNKSGDKYDNSRGFNDYWISEVNKSNGQLIWQKTIGGSYFDLANSTIETSDAGYLIGGYSNSSISGEKSEDSRGKHWSRGSLCRDDAVHQTSRRSRPRWPSRRAHRGRVRAPLGDSSC